MDEAIAVYVDGVMHEFPKSDATLVELFNDRTAAVVVNYAGKRYEGFVSPKTARKLDGYAAMERAIRFLIDAKSEQEIEKNFREIIDDREEQKRLRDELLRSKRRQAP